MRNLFEICKKKKKIQTARAVIINTKLGDGEIYLFTLKLRLFNQEFQRQTGLNARSRQQDTVRPTLLIYRQQMMWAFKNCSLQVMFSQRTVLETTTRDFLALALTTYLAEAEIICVAK